MGSGMLRLVIFDFDGVIADSEPGQFAVLQRVLQEQGIEMSWEQYCDSYLGVADFECFSMILRDFGGDHSEEAVRNVMAVKERRYSERLAIGSGIVIRGVPELMAQLAEDGVACAVCSGSSRRDLEFVLGREGLLDYIEVVVAAEDVRDPKPAPDGFLLTLKLVNDQLAPEPAIRPGQCLVVEDSRWGVQAARAAGMYCLAVETSHGADELALADYIEPDVGSLSLEKLQAMVP